MNRDIFLLEVRLFFKEITTKKYLSCHGFVYCCFLVLTDPNISHISIQKTCVKQSNYNFETKGSISDHHAISIDIYHSIFSYIENLLMAKVVVYWSPAHLVVLHTTQYLYLICFAQICYDFKDLPAVIFSSIQYFISGIPLCNFRSSCWLRTEREIGK